MNIHAAVGFALFQVPELLLIWIGATLLVLALNELLEWERPRTLGRHPGRRLRPVRH